MSFWNIDLDDWIRGRHFDESISAYALRTSGWYDNNNSRYNEYSEFHDIIEWYKADLPEKEDLLEEEFQDIPHHNKQEWPEELVIEEYQTIPEEQINLESFISYYYYINARPEVSSRRRRKTKEFKRSPNHRLSSYVSDDSRISVYSEPDVLYREEKEVVRGERDE